MEEKIVYIGLGSNLDDPAQQIRKAIAALGDLETTQVMANAGLFSSTPMGPEDQPDYLNTVVKLSTELDARALLRQCQRIEQQQGRIRTRHWGERTIDLDILLYDEQQIKTAELTVPHVGICQRDFVYLPLLKLDPDISIPGKGLLKEITSVSAMEKGDGFACVFSGNIE